MKVVTLTFAGTALSEEITPVQFEDAMTEIVIEAKRPWQKPDFSNQTSALGLTDGGFSTPVGMEERVNFWIDIYSKYSTLQGVLHDSRYVHLKYEDLDFTSIELDPNLSSSQKAKQKTQLVDARKAHIRNTLKKLARLSSPAGLEGEDLRYWYLFQRIDEPNKFLEASAEGRLRFQLGQSDRFKKGIFQSGRYIKQIEEVFRQESLPIELTRMIFVESSFNLRARSRVGASGIWQFMPRTGKQYLKIDQTVDERNDPLLSSRAAARLLRKNYEMLKRWPLAITGYNHGPYGVKRIVEKEGTSNIRDLVELRRGSFGFASASFFASFLAALEVESNANKYFGDTLAWDLAFDGEQFKLANNIDSDKLKELFQSIGKDLELYNPHLTSLFFKGVTWLRKGHVIWVPTEQKAALVASMESYKMASKKKGQIHIVQRGDTLLSIAQRFGVSFSRLKQINDIKDASFIKVGQEILISN